MIVTYQFRLYPTKTQAKLIDLQLEQHRLLYNHCLAMKIEAYKKDKTSLSGFDLIKSEVKKFSAGCNYSSLQQTIRRLDKAYKSFFRQSNPQRSGFPRFRARGRFRTIQYCKIGDGCKILPTEIYLQHIGKVYLKKHRKMIGEATTLSVTKNARLYFVNICVEVPSNGLNQNVKQSTAIGIDFGIRHTLTTSEGEKITTPDFRKQQGKELAKLYRKKHWLALNTVYRKILNRRKNFNHQLSRKLVNAYSTICLEDLQVSKIISKDKQPRKKANINNKLLNAGISQLINFITYKAESAGNLVVMVDPAYTTQTCPECLMVKPKSLNDRIHKCECGCIMDRDTAAAKNILRLGLQSLLI